MNKFYLILIFVSLVILGSIVYFIKAVNLLDRESPSIQIINPPQGLNNKKPYDLKIQLADSAGLAGFAVRAIYRKKLYEVYKGKLTGEKSWEQVIPLDFSKFNFPQGTIELEIRVYDRSFYSNFSILRIPIILDYDSPQIAAVSAQHNTMPGGVEPIFYKASDKHLASSGVIQGNKLYKGYPARLIDIKFRDPNLFIAFFAINPDDTSAPRLFAIDESGNETTAK